MLDEIVSFNGNFSHLSFRCTVVTLIAHISIPVAPLPTSDMLSDAM